MKQCERDNLISLLKDLEDYCLADHTGQGATDVDTCNGCSMRGKLILKNVECPVLKLFDKTKRTLNITKFNESLQNLK